MAAVPLGWKTEIKERPNEDADNGRSRVKTEKE